MYWFPATWLANWITAGVPNKVDGKCVSHKLGSTIRNGDNFKMHNSLLWPHLIDDSSKHQFQHVYKYMLSSSASLQPRATEFFLFTCWRKECFYCMQSSDHISFLWTEMWSSTEIDRLPYLINYCRQRVMMKWEKPSRGLGTWGSHNTLLRFGHIIRYINEKVSTPPPHCIIMQNDSPLLVCRMQSWNTACHFSCSFSVAAQK